MSNLYLRKNNRQRYRFTFVLIVGLLFLFCSGQFLTKEISPNEAIQWGIEHNLDLQTLRYSIEDIQRNLEILETDKSFQIDLSITPIWRFGVGNDSFLVKMEENRFAPEGELTLGVKKLLIPDLSLTSQVTWQSENLTDLYLENLVKEVNISIRLDKKLYPDTYTALEREVYSLENNLQMKLAELRWKEVEKQIEFIRQYLNIVRLQEQVDLIFKRLELKEEELARIRAQIELGEGGKQKETEAQIAVEEVKNELERATQNLTQAQKQWSVLLNLPDEVTVSFDPAPVFLKDLIFMMENWSYTQGDRDELVNQALQENYQIKNNVLEKEELLKDLQWTIDDGKPLINISGGYAVPDSEWFIMLDFKANLSDGGAQKLKVKQKEENIKRKELSTDFLRKTLRLEAEQLLDQDLYNQLFLQTQLKVLEEEKNKVKIIELQYQKEAVSKVQWEMSLITLKEKELVVREAYDQWLIDRLKLAHFIGYLRKGI